MLHTLPYNEKDYCEEWVESMGVATYIDFLILLIPTPLVFVPFYSSIPTFCSFFNVFRSFSKERWLLFFKEVSCNPQKPL